MNSVRVLIVEPSRIFQQLVARVLEGEGAECVHAASVAEGLRRLDEEKFEIVCVAALLPDGDGATFTASARRRSHASHLPVIMLTAGIDEETLARSKDAGVTEVFLRSEIRSLARYVEAAVRDARSSLSGRVLLVDSSAATAKGIARTLEGAGLSVDAFQTAAAAIEAFDAGSYDLVLSDVVLDDAAGGVGIVQYIRLAQGSRQRVPVLAMSAFGDAARRIELLRAGANDLMHKPFAPEELLARVANLIANKQLVDRVEAQQVHLKTLALTDQLTSLHNRHFLIEAAQLILSAARRHQHPVTVLVVDIDHFKLVNDTHGHARGDRVLVEVAAVLKRSCREEDVAARFGGEEFVLVCARCPAEGAALLAERLRRQVEALVPDGIPVTVSIGTTTLPAGRSATFESLFSAADKALYDAKHGGRNRVVARDLPFHDPPPAG